MFTVSKLDNSCSYDGPVQSTCKSIVIDMIHAERIQFVQNVFLNKFSKAFADQMRRYIDTDQPAPILKGPITSIE